MAAGPSRWDDRSRRLAGLVLLRALITSALFGAALATSTPIGEEGPAKGVLYAFLLTAYISSALELAWILGGRALGILAWFHAAVETALAGWLVALTGGPAGPFSFLFLLSTVHGAIAAGSTGAFGAASLATLLLAVLGTHPALPFWTAPLAGAGDPSRVAAAILANSGGCFATAALASYLTQRLQRTGRALSARELELRHLGELYRSVVQSLGSGLLTVETDEGDARVSLLNEAGAAILGVEAAASRGRSLAELSPELAEGLGIGLPGSRGECSILSSGQKKLIGFTVSPLHDLDGARLGSVVAFQDVTELRRMEASLRRQSHLASLGELSAGLAHEIRNPLAALSGAVQMLSAAPPSAEDARLLELVQRESAHLGKLVSDFLVFARPPPPALREGNLADLAAACCEGFEAVAAKKARAVARRIQPAPARFDPDQMRQVVDNLLRNALEATSPGGHIAVTVETRGPASVLVVDDDGPGVPPEAIPHLFEPFFTTKEKGTGLGLALVARIVAAHGGSVDLEPKEGPGARFAVSLPVVATGG